MGVPTVDTGDPGRGLTWRGLHSRYSATHARGSSTQPSAAARGRQGLPAPKLDGAPMGPAGISMQSASTRHPPLCSFGPAPALLCSPVWLCGPATGGGP